MKFTKKIISAVVVCSVLLGLCVVSYAESVNSAADEIYLNGSNVIVSEDTTVTGVTGGSLISKAVSEGESEMEISLYTAVPEDGAYKLEIVSSQGGEYSTYDSIYINGAAVSLPTATSTSDDGLNTYNIRSAEFNRGTNEIKFSLGAAADSESAKFLLSYVKITPYGLSAKGADYTKHTNDKWIEEKTEDLSAHGESSAYKYQSYNTTANPFYAEYTFYVDADGEYSLTGVMSYPDGDSNKNKYYSTCKILWDDFESSCDVVSTKMLDYFGKSVYSGIMLEKGIHTLKIVSLPRESNGEYNLYVGDLTLTKTGDYAKAAKEIEIMGNEYTSLGGMTIEEKNDLKLVSSDEVFTDWKFAKSNMASTDTDTVTYSFDAPKAGYYSFEGWLNSNSSQWVSASTVTIDSSEISLAENNTVTTTSTGTDAFYIVQKTIPNTEPKLWLDKGTHTLEVKISPTTNSVSKDSPSINARIWKFIFTLISEDDVYIPALNYEGESAVTPTAVTNAAFPTGEASEAMEYYSFKDDNKTDNLVLTYKFTPTVTAEYTFEGWASAIYSYLSSPEFYLDGIKMETKEDKSVTSSDGVVRRHIAEGVELTAGQEYTLKVEFLPKTNGSNINAKLWKMTFNRESGRDMTSVVSNNNRLMGSFYVEAQEVSQNSHIICAQYDDDGRLAYVTAEPFELKASEKFSTASFAIELDDFDANKNLRLFIYDSNIAPLFEALDIR